MASEAETLAIEVASLNIRLRLLESRVGALETELFPRRKVPRADDPAPPPPDEPAPEPPADDVTQPPPIDDVLISNNSAVS